MKKREVVVSLILIIIASFVTLGLCWHNSNKASKNLNLIVQESHINENINVASGDVDLSLEYKLKEMELQTENENGVTTEVKGNMPETSRVETSSLNQKEVMDIAKIHKLNLDEKDVVLAYDMSIKVDKSKYQPEEYGEEVSISISNLDIDKTKSYAILHIKDDGSIETLDITSISQNQIKFKTKSFSTYIVVSVEPHSINFEQGNTFNVKSSNGIVLQNNESHTGISNFEFFVEAKSGNIIKSVTLQNENGEDRSNLLEISGNDYAKVCNIIAITENLVVNVETEEAPENAQNTTLNIEYYYNEGSLITEWEIPQNNTTIVLPVTGYVDMLVYWGDGNKEFISGDINENNMITHTYTEARTYDIDVSGIIENWGTRTYFEDAIVPADNKYYTYTKYLTGLKQWGDLSAKSYGFSACTNLEYVSGKASEDTFKNVTTMERMFNNCTSLESIDLSQLNTSNVKSTANMFYNCKELTNLNLNNINTSNVEDMGYMFNGCELLADIDLSTFNTVKVKSMEYMFGNCKKITNLDLTTFSSAQLEKTSYMFSFCTKLTKIDFGKNFKAEHVTDMSFMFRECNELTTIDLSNFNTENVMNMTSMFRACNKITNINISNFNTSNVEDMSYMFYQCYELKNVDLSGFNTSNVETMNRMFAYDSKLEVLDLSGFDTRAVTNMENMLYGASKLNCIQLSSDFEICSQSTKAFESCDKLEKIIVTTGGVNSNQFADTLSQMYDVVFYVPNNSVEDYQEEWTSIDSSKIKPIVEPVGGIKDNMLKGAVYEETACTIAGYAQNQSEIYNMLGYNLTNIDGTVNTNEVGEYPVTYTVTRKYQDENGQTVENSFEAEKTVYVYDGAIVEYYENTNKYDGEWTNADIIAVVDPLMEETTWVEVKIGNSEWTSTPSYANIEESGDKFVVIFNQTLQTSAYVREIGVNGKITAYASSAQTLKIDKTMPGIELVKTFTEEQKLSLNAKVYDNESGLKSYSIVYESEAVKWKDASNSIEEKLKANGTYYLWLKDNAGNEFCSDPIVAKKDNIAPAGTIEIIADNVVVGDEYNETIIVDANKVSGEKYTNKNEVTIKINAMDDNTITKDIKFVLLNEEDYVKAKNKELEFVWQDYTEEIVWELQKSGKNIIYAIFKDEAGNTSVAIDGLYSVDAEYVVYHYVENINDNNYSLYDTENKIDIAGIEMDIFNIVKTIEGATYSFTSYEENGSSLGESFVIEEDGSTAIYVYYDRNEYTITFNANGGTINSSASIYNTTVKHSSIYGEATSKLIVAREGHNFLGWFTQATGGTKIEDTKKVTASETVYAQWETIEYAIEYNLDGGTVATSNQTSYTTTTNGITLTNPTKEGYSFDGWTEEIKAENWSEGYINETTGEAEISEEHPNSVYSEKILLEEGATYTLEGAEKGTLRVYDLDGTFKSSEELEAYVASLDNNFLLAAANRNSYTADEDCYVRMVLENGATESEKENTTLKSNKQTSVTIKTGSTGHRSYTANYVVQSYTITFNTNGGSAVPSITKEYGASITAPTAPSKTGYTFAGWDKEVPATMPAENITITAKWTVNTYTITFNTDGGSAVASITKEYGASIPAPTAPTKAGYVFAGWDKEIPTTMPAENITITAKWTANTYTVTFNGNGGTISGATTVTRTVAFGSTYGNATSGFPEATRDGYTFLGWFTDAVAGEQVMAETTVTESANSQTLYAHWESEEETAQTTKTTYNANGGTFGVGTTNIVKYTIEEVETTKTQISKTANVSDDGLTASSAGYGNNQAITDVIRIPGVTGFTVKITYQTENTNYDWVAVYDGSVTPSASNYSSSKSGKLGGTSKSTKTISITGDTVQIFFKSDSSNHNYFGYYAEISYKCTENVPSIVNSQYKEPTREGYEFIGWSTDSNSTEVEYAPGAENIPLESKELYAIWSFKITFDANGGTIRGSEESKTDRLVLPGYKYKDSNEELPMAKKSGYTFLGWFTEIEGGEELTLETLVTSTQTVYAHWEEGEAIAIFSATDGSLTFLRAGSIPEVGSEYEDKIVSAVYRDIEITPYRLAFKDDMGMEVDTATSIVPEWLAQSEKILKVEFKDKITPISTAGWFYSLMNLSRLELKNLDTSKVTNMSCMFYMCTSLTKLDLSHFDTSKVTDMSNLFCNMYGIMIGMFNDVWMNLEELNIKGWDTSNVSNMSFMFAGLAKLTSLDLNHIDTSSATNMTGMFLYDILLQELDISKFNTSNVQSFGMMFYGCMSLQNLDVSSFRTDNCIVMTGMFAMCQSLTNLDVSNFDTSNVQAMDMMFAGLGVTTLDVSNFDTSNVVTMNGMFSANMYLQDLDLSNFNTTNVTDMAGMFNECPTLSSLNLSSFDTTNVTDMLDMFTGCIKLQEVRLGEKFAFIGTDGYLPAPSGEQIEGADGTWYNTYTGMAYAPEAIPNNIAAIYEATKPVIAIFSETDNSLTFTRVSSVPAVNSTYEGKVVSAVFTGIEKEQYFVDKESDETSNYPGWTDLGESITSVIIKDKVTPVSTAGWFAGMKNLTTLDLTNLNTSKVTDMSLMFLECAALTTIDVTGLDTRNVTNMMGMFNGCAGLTTLDLSKFNTSKVTDMMAMFAGAAKLAKLDLSSFDTRNVTDMMGMFAACESLAELNISSFNTEKVTDMSMMFAMTSLLELNLRGFDTRNVTNMYMMFYFSQALTRLDVSSFDTSNVESMGLMFALSGNLTNLDLSSFDTSKVTDMSSMFTSCNLLEEVKLGEKFAFVGTNGYLPAQTDSNIPGADGKWYNTKTLEGYAPNAIPANTSATYVAVPLLSEAIAIFSETDNSLTFTRVNEIPAVGSTYNEKEVTEVYTGIEDENYYFKWDYTIDNEESIPDFVAPGWSEIADRIEKVEFLDRITPNSTSEWFAGMTKVSSIDLSKLDTSYTTDMSGMFANCGITELDLRTLDTSKVIDMGWMFALNMSLERVNVSSFNTSNVTNMRYMFGGISTSQGCLSLKELDLTSFDTSNVTDMSYMFACAVSLEKVDVSSFNTSKVNDMQAMFAACMALTSFNKDNSNSSTLEFDTRNVTNMSYMFIWLQVPELDLSNFETPSLQYASQMFAYASVKKINLSQFDTSNVVDMTWMLMSVRLEEIVLGEKFAFIGTEQILPITDSSNVPGADGKWYNIETGVGYVSDSVPSNEKATYSSIPRYTVTFNANSGTIEDLGSTSTTRIVAFGKTYGSGDAGFPVAVRSHYKFVGWYTDVENGTLVTAETIVDGTAAGLTLYARWENIMDLIVSTANAPVLGEGMKAVYWTGEDGTGETIADAHTTSMYNYTLGDGRTDTKESKWANAVTTSDGSYWVWIPRYAYKITYEDSTGIYSEEKNGYGNIDILFMYEKSNTQYRDKDGNAVDLPEGYKVHPAFQAMTTEADLAKNPLGKWDTELKGIWVAKYETSKETSTDGGTTWNPNTLYADDTLTVTGSKRMISKPSTLCWGRLTADKMYRNSLNMHPTLNSHLMKNSEWGAVAYLAHSPYGRNGNEVAVNQSSYTGGGPGLGASNVYNSTYSFNGSEFAATYAWNTEQGKKASTTGNIYGVYDMSGGESEVVAAYIDADSSYITTSTAGGALGTATDMKTKQVYGIDYEANSYIYGDAIYETSTGITEGVGGMADESWFNDYSEYPTSYEPFFRRGGYDSNADNAGIFNFTTLAGQIIYTITYRPVLCVNN